MRRGYPALGRAKKKERGRRRELLLLRRASDQVLGLVKRNRSIVRGCLIFIVSIAIATFVYSHLVDTGALDGFQRFIASATGFLVNLLGGNVSVYGNSVFSSSFSMYVVAQCTGVAPMIIFLAAVLAYPSRIRDKAIGMALGLLALFVLNLIRMFSLFHIGSAFPSFLHTAHFLLWQSLIILAALTFWILWVGRLAHARGS